MESSVFIVMKLPLFLSDAIDALSRRYAKTIRGYFLALSKPKTPVNVLNLLDALAVFSSVFIDFLAPAGTQFSFVSLFRVIRMVRILRSLKRFKVIFRTLKHLLPALARSVASFSDCSPAWLVVPVFCSRCES